jgi:hypothetical protein
MGPWFTMAVELLQHGGFHLSMGLWFSSLLQHYGPHLSMGHWYMVVHQVLRMECKVAREVVGGPIGPIVIIVDAIQCKVV